MLINILLLLIFAMTGMNCPNLTGEMILISVSATTLTTESIYSKSNDEGEYGGDDGEYDSFGGESDNDDKDAGYDRQLELDHRGRLCSVSIAVRANSSPHIATPCIVPEQVAPVQAGSLLHGTNAVPDTVQPQLPRVCHCCDTSQAGEGGGMDEARKIEGSLELDQRLRNEVDLLWASWRNAWQDIVAPDDLQASSEAQNSSEGQRF